MSTLAPPPAMPPTPRLPPDESEIRSWQMWCHLSALAGLFIPFGNILGPLLIWQMKKTEVPSIEAHGKAAVNFQITNTLATVVSSAAAFILFFFFCLGLLVIPLVLLITVLGVVFAIIAANHAKEGRGYNYPLSLTFIS